MLTSDDMQRISWITELGEFALANPKHFDACVQAMEHLARGGSQPELLIQLSRAQHEARVHASSQPPVRTAFAQ